MDQLESSNEVSAAPEGVLVLVGPGTVATRWSTRGVDVVEAMWSNAEGCAEWAVGRRAVVFDVARSLTEEGAETRPLFACIEAIQADCRDRPSPLIVVSCLGTDSQTAARLLVYGIHAVLAHGDAVTELGEVLGAVARERTLERLAHRHEVLLRSLRRSGHGHYCTRLDQDGEILDISKKAAMLLGRSKPEELIGRLAAPGFYADTEDRDRFLARVRDGRGSVVLEAVDLHTPLGEKVFVVLEAFASTWHDGTPCVRGLMHDVTSRARLEDLLEQTRHAHYEADAKGRTLHESRVGLEILGYAVEELRGKNRATTHWAHPNERAPFVAEVAAAPDGRVENRCMRFRRKSGDQIWVEGTSSVRYDEAGRPAGISGVYREVTDREEERRGSDLLGSLLGSLSSPEELLSNLCEGVRDLTDAAVTLAGLADAETPEVLLRASRGAPLSAFNVDGLLLAPWLGIATADGTPRMIEDPALLKGAIVPALREARSVLNLPLVAEGRVIGHVLASLKYPYELTANRRDLLRRLSARAGGLLHQAGEVMAGKLLSQMFSESSAGKAIEDIDSYLNGVLRVFMSHVPCEGLSIFRVRPHGTQRRIALAATTGLVGRPSREEVYYDWEEAQLTPLAAREGWLRTKTKEDHRGGGSPKFAEVTDRQPRFWLGGPITDSCDQVVGVVRLVNKLVASPGSNRGIVSHFSELDEKAVRGVVRLIGLMLETAVEEGRRRDHVQRISHELVSPLAAIRSDAEYLRRAPRPEFMVQTKLDNILMDAQLAIGVAQRLAHVGGMRRPLQMTPTNMGRHVVHKVRYGLRPELQARGFDPDRVRVSGFDDGPWVDVDVSALNQIVFNLMVNAIKYSHKDPERFQLEVTAGREGESLTFRFSDWGIGVDPEHRERIFESNFQTPAAVAHDFGGVGLGLAISRDFANRHGGWLTLEHEAQPTTFLLKLPASRLCRGRARGA